MTDKIQELWDREMIRDVIYKYCFGVDAQDWESVRDCFTSTATHQHTTFKGNNDEFIAFASGVIGDMGGTLHSIGSVLISIEHDVASSQSTFVSYHRVLNTPAAQKRFQMNGQNLNWIVAGRYVDKWEKVGELWKISERRAFHDWTKFEPATA